MNASSSFTAFRDYFPLRTYNDVCQLFDKFFKAGSDTPLVFATFVLAALSEQTNTLLRCGAQAEEASVQRFGFHAIEYEAVCSQIDAAQAEVVKQFGSVRNGGLYETTLKVAEYCSAIMSKARNRTNSRTVDSDKTKSTNEFEPVRSYFTNSEQLGEAGRLVCLTIVACALLGLRVPTLVLSECHVWLRISVELNPNTKAKHVDGMKACFESDTSSWTDVELSCQRGRSTLITHAVDAATRYANWRYAADAPVILSLPPQLLGAFVTLGALDAHCRRVLLRVAYSCGALEDYPLATCAYAELQFAARARALRCADTAEPDANEAILTHAQICSLFQRAIRTARERYRDRHLEPLLKYASLLLNSAQLCDAASDSTCVCLCHTSGALAQLCAASAVLMRVYAFTSDNAPVFDGMVSQFSKRGTNALRTVIDCVNAEVLSIAPCRSRQCQATPDAVTRKRRRTSRPRGSTQTDEDADVDVEPGPAGPTDTLESKLGLGLIVNPLAFAYCLAFFDHLAAFEEQRYVTFRPNNDAAHGAPRVRPRFASWTDTFVRLLPRFTPEAVRHCRIVERSRLDEEDEDVPVRELVDASNCSPKCGLELESPGANLLDTLDCTGKRENGLENHFSRTFTSEEVHDIVQQCVDGRLVNLAHFFDSNNVPLAFTVNPKMAEANGLETAENAQSAALRQQLVDFKPLCDARRGALESAKRAALKCRANVNESLSTKRASNCNGESTHETVSTRCGCVLANRSDRTRVKLVRIALRSVRLCKLRGLLEQFSRADDAATRVQVATTIKLLLDAA